MTDEKLLEKNRNLLTANRALTEENRRLKRQIEAYVMEFRVCRLCKNMHSDCSPSDGSCFPRWGGL